MSASNHSRGRSMSKVLSRSVVRRAVLASIVGAVSAAVVQTGCSSVGEGSGGTNDPSTETGKATVEFTLPGGEQLNSVSWTVTGPGTATTFSKSGTITMDGGSSDGGDVVVSFSLIVTGAVPTNNYTATVSGASTDGTVTCYGSTTFSVNNTTGAAGVTAPIACGPASDAGRAIISGSLYGCASISSLSALPLETTVGNAVALSATATGPIADGGALTYVWTATSGTFDTPNAASANFTCSVAGPATVTLTVGDGPVADGGACLLAKQSIQIQCDL